MQVFRRTLRVDRQQTEIFQEVDGRLEKITDIQRVKLRFRRISVSPGKRREGV